MNSDLRTGFIGLGTLGRVMAARLIAAGTPLTVWNRTLARADGLEAHRAANPAELMSQSDVVFLNLFDSDAVRDVLHGDQGLLQGECKGKIVVDTTTNHFDAVGAFYDALEAAGAVYLEAPVFGSVPPASQGALTIVVSGDRTTFSRVRPLLDQLGRNIFHFEQRTLATRMKLVNNSVLGVFMTAIAEAVAYGEACGIDTRTVLDILSVGAANSGVFTAKKERLAARDYEKHFSVDAIDKDLDYMQDLARELNRPLHLAPVAKAIFDAARARDLGNLDFSAVYEVLNPPHHQ